MPLVEEGRLVLDFAVSRKPSAASSSCHWPAPAIGSRGGSASANAHFDDRVIVLDGVLSETRDGAVRFDEAPVSLRSQRGPTGPPAPEQA